jgi:hypothetical protein
VRTPVYDQTDVQVQYGPLIEREEARTHKRVVGRKARTLRKTAEKKANSGDQVPPGVSVSETQAPDNYVSKIAKYVPAETIAVLALLFAAFKPSTGTVWWWVAGGALANCVYLLSLALGQPKTVPRPRLYFYFLSIVALVLWAMATLGPVKKAAGLTGENGPSKQAALLALAAFIVPALDTVLTKLDIRVKT